MILVSRVITIIMILMILIIACTEDDMSPTAPILTLKSTSPTATTLTLKSALT